MEPRRSPSPPFKKMASQQQPLFRRCIEDKRETAEDHMPTPLPFILVRLLAQDSDALEYVDVCSLDHLTHEEALVRYVRPDNYASEVNNGRLI